MLQGRKIYHIVSNSVWGGGEQFVYDLSQRQLKEGIEIEIFCKPIEKIERKFSDLGVKVHTLHLGGAVDLWSAWRMKQIVAGSGECYIHAHNFKDAFTAAYARRMMGEAGEKVHVVMCRHLTRPAKRTFPYPWLYSHIDALCFDSELARETFLSTKPEIDTGKLMVVHTSIVVPERIEAVSLRERYSIAEGTPIAMFHGRLDPEKGLDVLVSAAALLGDIDFRLIIVGSGSEQYTRHLQGLIAEKGIGEKVIMAGFQHPVLPFIAKADIGILPSTVREGCPLSPMEYMSQAIPVVATDNGGQKEYIESGVNGLLVTPGDVESLAAALRRLLTDGEERREMGRKAQADFMAELNYDKFYENISAIYGMDRSK